MIQGFKDDATRRLYDEERVKKFAGIKKQAWRKLDMLNAAASLDDLRSPPATGWKR